MATNSFDPIANGATPFDPIAQGAVPVNQQDPNEGAFTSAIDKTGAFNIPLLGGVLKGLTTPFTTAAETAAEGARAGGQILSGDRTPFKPAFISQNENNLLTGSPLGPLEQAGKLAPDLALSLLAPEFKGANFLDKGAELLGKEAPVGVKAAALNSALKGGLVGGSVDLAQPDSSVGSVAGSTALGGLLGPILEGVTSGKLTQRGVNRLTDQAVSKGTSTDTQAFTQAVNDHLNNVADISNVKPDVRQEVQNLLERLPGATGVGTAGTEDLAPKELTSTWMQDFKQAMGDIVNWDKANQSNAPTPAKQEAAKILYKVSADQLHQMAPGTGTLDTINHFYYNPLIKGGRLPIVGNHKYPAAVTGIPSLGMNAIIASILGEGAAKKLGF